MTTLGFIVIVVSFGRYDLIPMIPLVFYPTVIMALSETPYSLLLKRFSLALPFCLFAGISNLFLDTGVAFTLGFIPISLGVLSFFVLLFKTYLCVMAVLLLVATTPISDISGSLRTLRVPTLMVSLFEMTYRYIGTLLEEASSLYTAYRLRSGRKKGIELKHMGSFVGQLLLRSFDRSERIYEAMKLRGYPAMQLTPTRKRVRLFELLYLLGILGFSLFFRIFDFTVIFNLFTGRFIP